MIDSQDAPQDAGCLLIAGGNLDPNIQRLIEIAQQKQIPTQILCQQPELSPPFSWDLSQEPPEAIPQLAPQSARVRGAFIRCDVFGTGATTDNPNPLEQKRALGWYQTIQGWLLAHPQVRLLNRQMVPIASNKVATLALAQRVGLSIPQTQITNEATQIQQYAVGSAIAKPVAGGGFCQSLDDLKRAIRFQNGCAAMPAIVQNRLAAPEIRIYVIGQHTLAFEMRSPSLDYRVNQDAQVLPVETPSREAALLRQLMVQLQMDFGAADFKTDPKTGKLVFLELNTSPMFVRFDRVAEGALCAAIAETLYG